MILPTCIWIAGEGGNARFAVKFPIGYDVPMPAKSKAQLRAMYAAKAGNSTLGIPKSVGADFVAATPTTKGLPQKAAKAPRKPLGDEFDG
jgi:hypothetical protein